ncbi:CapA family protein [Brevibacillus composti]|uniref:CapA family protein n=1 Tax=Brevibacillus composti TaxID=2796470 RepID=A0A7T5EPF2_9BACL|nr:CapA family protein [Brevibacillus composti]QQE76329.1 CapA family protein [Brevibacillus composti]QUO43356.1 CapA family protein [Brevibacillus composti]
MYSTRTERLRAKRRRTRKLLTLLLSTIVFTLAVLAACLLYIMGKGIWSNEAKPPNQPVQQEPDAAITPPSVVHLSFVGDMIFSGHVEARLMENGFDFPYAHVYRLFQQDDYTIANLETPITENGKTAANKQYVFKAAPEVAPAMKRAGIDLVNLANNHSMDHGESGLLDTFRILDEHELRYMGAGRDAEQAYAPVYVERNGIRLAFFGFSRVVPEVSWYAGNNKPGIAASYDPSKAVDAIKRARNQADLIIVVVHWGKEREDYPVDHQIELSRSYIEAGADLVVGGHPHVLQGFEAYRNKWIAYSLGNFIFTRSHEPKTWETMILQASCTKDGDCQLRMLPHHAELGQAVPMDEENGQNLIKRIESLSKDVRILPDGRVTSVPSERD